MFDDIRKNLHTVFHERIEEMQKSRGLRIWILHILDEHGPRNGVEIMDAVQSHHERMQHIVHHVDQRGHHGHSKYAKRPSPGSVYPMLKKMVDENLIIKMEDGRYELTEKGEKTIRLIFGHVRRKNMDRNAIAIENALMEMDGYVSYIEDIKKEKLIAHEELIGNLSERLKKIKESFHED